MYILPAEIHAIVTGLKIAWQKGFRKVLLDSDSLLSINKIKLPIKDKDPMTRLTLECKHLLEKD